MKALHLHRACFRVNPKNVVDESLVPILKVFVRPPLAAIEAVSGSASTPDATRPPYSHLHVSNEMVSKPLVTLNVASDEIGRAGPPRSAIYVPPMGGIPRVRVPGDLAGLLNDRDGARSYGLLYAAAAAVAYDDHRAAGRYVPCFPD